MSLPRFGAQLLKARMISSPAARRSFSILPQIRAAIRAAEPHPFERYPTTQKMAKPDWGRQFRHVGDAAMFFFPMFAVFIGWPLAAEYVMDGHIS